jgi:SAM-dependent methyltransferase
MTAPGERETVFGPAYASHYDLLYGDKDYSAECDFLEVVFQQHGQGKIVSVLDLGCGTGSHALLLVKRGYVVTGADRSSDMLAIARQRAAVSGVQVDFRLGDIRTLNLDRSFDAVISMFAVMSYQVSNADLSAAFRAAHRHLRSGGLFVFDCWYGPAVLAERPANRLRIIENGEEQLFRFVSPVLDVLSQTVVVNYHLLCLKGDRVVENAKEAHGMRFFFAQEIRYFLETNGFEMVSISPFLDISRPPGETDWNIAVVARARA